MIGATLALLRVPEEVGTVGPTPGLEAILSEAAGCQPDAAAAAAQWQWLSGSPAPSHLTLGKVGLINSLAITLKAIVKQLKGAHPFTHK